MISLIIVVYLQCTQGSLNYGLSISGRGDLTELIAGQHAAYLGFHTRDTFIHTLVVLGQLSASYL